MKNLTIEEICQAMNGTLVCGDSTLKIKRVSIDSREVTRGELFFALIGEQHDAHKFISDAKLNGCEAFVVSKQEGIELDDTGCYILVEDTTKALQVLAAYYLSLFQMVKIGVTGSTGKTSTKEMVYQVFSQKYKTARNLGNFNNHIGLPLTVLSIEEGTEVGVFEMGMSEFEEIDLLANIVRPDVGIITNIGISHIENLGSRENILKAKLEITNYFNENNLLIANEDQDFLSKQEIQGDYKLVTTGETGRSQFIISSIEDYGEDGISFMIEHREEIQKITLPIPGRHNAYNAALAVAAGVQYGISMAQAAEGLKQLELTDKRLNIKGKNGMKVIDDTYNASPDSMKAAIDVLMATKGFRKIAILADMFELGVDSNLFHQEVGLYAAEKNVDLLIAVGESGKFIADGAKKILGENKIIYYETKELLIKDIGSMISSGDVILLKGSRGMAMDQVVKKIMEMN